MSNTFSLSVDIGPVDSRCKYWAKIIRASVAIPEPMACDGANAVPGAYLRKGSDELTPGDYMIEGEENHHRYARGWNYRITYCVESDATSFKYQTMNKSVKDTLNAQGLPVDLLKGAGDVAACIRALHGLRAGLFTGFEPKVEA